MRQPNATAGAPAPAEIAALGTLTIGCFGLTAPFSEFNPALSGGGSVAVASVAARTLSGFGVALAGITRRRA